MIFRKLEILWGAFGTQNPAAGEMAQRWGKAFTAEPDLASDLIQLSGLLATQPVELIDGEPQPRTMNTTDLAYQAGRQDFARELLALGNLTTEELNTLLES
ncbi:MAG: hypothetical protein AAFR53_14195 [Pseudomonadota bacterium]